jgi:hypothetical protein
MSLEFIVETPRGIFSMGISLPARGAICTRPSFEPAAGTAATGDGATCGATGAGAAASGAAFFLGAAFFCAVGAGAFFWMTSTGGSSLEGAGVGAVPSPDCCAITVFEIAIVPAKSRHAKTVPVRITNSPRRAG